MMLDAALQEAAAAAGIQLAVEDAAIFITLESVEPAAGPVV